MYNRYIPEAGRYTKIPVPEDLPPPPGPEPPPPDPGGLSALLAGWSEKKKNAGPAGIFHHLHLDEIDSGDLLLLLILFFLFREGEDPELLILLGLVLLLGLGDSQEV